MKILSNHLSHRIEAEAMKNKLLPHLIGPLTTFGLTVLIEILSQFEWYTPSLALAFIGLAVSAVYGGLRSSLLSAVIITGYGLVEFNFDVARLSQTAAAALSIAVVNGVGRQLLIKWHDEAEANKRAAELIDSLNGNVKKVLQALATLDGLRSNVNGYSKAKILEEIDKARAPLITLTTLVQSWQEINESKKAAFDRLNEMGGYPYRVDDTIREIRTLQFELISRVDYLGKIMEKEKRDET